MAASNADAMRYLATVKRQSAPPRCNPFTIVLLVLALGMLFIGLTMTIIAHWPGSTSIGENPLKIAGPILLAVGSFLFIVGVILICCLNRRERRRWERMIMKFAASRPPVDQSSFGPSSQKPTAYDDSRGGASGTAPLLGSQPPEKGSDGNRGYGPPQGYYKEGYQYSGDGNAVESSFTMDEDDGVPDPVRATKKRRPKKSGTGSNDDLSGGENVLVGTTGTTKTMTTTTTTTVVKRTGADGKVTEETTTTRSKRSRSKDAIGSDDSWDAAGDGAAAASAAGGRSGARGGPGSQPSASPGGSRRLLVHVKAQPGATVHIHPGGPAVAPKPAFSSHSHSTASGETDI